MSLLLLFHKSLNVEPKWVQVLKLVKIMIIQSILINVKTIAIIYHGPAVLWTNAIVDVNVHFPLPGHVLDSNVLPSTTMNL